MLQIRNVPEELHHRLKARAALAGMSLSEWSLAELARSLERPTRQEILERLASRTSVHTEVSPEIVVREERDRL